MNLYSSRTFDYLTMSPEPELDPDAPSEEPSPNDLPAFKASFTTSVVANARKLHGSISPYTMREIIDSLHSQTNGWPRRVGNTLFVHDDDHGVGWLQKPAALFGWLQTRVGRVTWHNRPDCVKQSEVFSELNRTSQQYVSVEELPHEPPIDGHYYACDSVEPGDGAKLRELLDRFNPATDIDRDLIQAALMTAAWGGGSGLRPCFIITSDDGRGAGKTTVAKCIGHVWNGLLTFSSGEDIGKICTRLLSPEALPKRLCLLDNLKSLKFSWAELEAMITAPIIGGHRMYTGEASRPNILTWFITLNGASLSTDMAQRAVIIKVKKPNRSANWEEDTTRFILDNRQAIMADCIGALRATPTPLAKFTRWATWEKEILQRLPEPSDAQKVIIERQIAVDVEADEAELTEDFFADQLERLNYDTARDQVFLPSNVVARWFNWATNGNHKVVAVSRMVGQLIDEERLKKLIRNSTKSRGRGFVWHGPKADVEDKVKLDVEERLKSRGYPEPHA